jgi:cell division protein FtsI (penicillin-binding protein 3)
MMEHQHKNRIRSIALVFIVISSVFGLRLFWLQVVNGPFYEREADRQYITPKAQIFDRGSIYFTKKNGEHVSAATLKNGFKVAVNPKTISDPELIYQKVSPIIGIPYDTFMARAKKQNDTYEEIADGLTEVEAKQLSDLKIKDLQIYRQAIRMYPAESLAAHVIGFVGYKGDDFTGQYGLERFYNTTLSRTQSGLYVNFFAEVFSRIHTVVSEEIHTDGDIVTTIEPSVQKTLESEIGTVQTTWNSDRVGGIIMDSQTGAIYALGVSPAFNPNNYQEASSIGVYKNPLIENVMEVGSIMKPIIMAAGIESGAVSPETSYYDYGFVRVKNRTINNFDGRGRGQVTMQTVLDESLNTGMVFVMQHMKKSEFKEFFKSFGLGTKTGIDLPGEVNGLTNNIDTGGDVEFANIAFGQGVAVTPISMVRALNVLGNGGVLVQPHVVTDIEYTDGQIEKKQYDSVEGVISPETSDTISKMLVHVFDSYGDGKYKFDRYTVAGKTGTAQMANPAGGYYDDRNLHSFFGYFPAYNPRFIVYLYNEYPKNGARYASQTLIEPFTHIAKFLINYYNIPPDR